MNASFFPNRRPGPGPDTDRLKRGKRRSLRWVAIAAAVAALTACTGPNTSSTGQSGGKHDLRIGVSTGPSTLDPAKDGGGLPNQLRSLTNQALFHMHPDYSATPALVEKFGYVGEGNKVFEFTLKPGIRFTDGEPLNAAAAKTWLEYFGAQPGPFASMLQIASIETEGDYTVRLNLAAPNPQVPLLLSEYGNRGCISSPKAVAQPELLASGTYGVGPYKMDASRSTLGDHYSLVPADTYFDKSAIRFNSVDFRVISNAQSMLQAFSAGQIDFGNLDTTVAATAEAAGVTVKHWKSGTVVVTLLDRAGKLAPGLADVRVRQALNYALDRKTITEAIVGKYGKATSQVQTDQPVPELDDAYPYDPDRARSLLAEAGYANGLTVDVVDPGTSNGVWGSTTMQAVAEAWEKVGVKVNVTSATTDYVQQILSGKTEAFEWTTDVTPTFVTHSVLYGQKASLNPFGVANPELEALFQKASTQQGDDAAKTWREYNTMVTKQALNVPVYEYQIPWGMSKNIGGVAENSWMPFASDLTWNE